MLPRGRTQDRPYRPIRGLRSSHCGSFHLTQALSSWSGFETPWRTPRIPCFESDPAPARENSSGKLYERYRANVMFWNRFYESVPIAGTSVPLMGDQSSGYCLCSKMARALSSMRMAIT